MICLPPHGVTASWRWSGLRRSSTRDSRSSPSCARRGTRSRSRFSLLPRRNARSPCSPSAGSPPFAPRKPAPTRSRRTSRGARPAPGALRLSPNGRATCRGAGGALAEIYRDYALRLAPVSEEEAAAMIAEVKGLATLRGYRGLPPGDVRALAQAVAALSRLALIGDRPVAEAEINPLMVKRE